MVCFHKHAHEVTSGSGAERLQPRQGPPLQGSPLGGLAEVPLRRPPVVARRVVGPEQECCIHVPVRVARGLLSLSVGSALDWPRRLRKVSVTRLSLWGRVVLFSCQQCWKK